MKTATATIEPRRRFTESPRFPIAPTRFLIHSREEIRIILFDEVVCCIAEGNYTMIYLTDGSKCMVSKTLKDVEIILYPSRFLRIHASYLVNLNCIKRILKSHSYRAELPFNLTLDISRSRQKQLLHRIEAMCGSMPYIKNAPTPESPSSDEKKTRATRS